ncbi:MAG TPA: ATP-binding cassette domain-containing protein [Desulfomonilaceae bacterium]|nr:ATP-binding cassette domain-containing protein [Desulfomonilaceae bacterium]
MNLLETKALTKHFGSLMAVNGVDFSIHKGELKSIIGPNGAGKTTFFNLLTGMFPPTDGQILFKDQNITGSTPAQVAGLGIGRSFQITSIFPELSVFDNVYIPALRYYSKEDARKRSMEILEDVDLADEAEDLAGNLSHGDKRHLDIAIALTCRSELLLLDEPTSGMPSEESARTAQLIVKLKKEHGYTIVLIEHKMDIVLAISDTITVLNFGFKLAEGTPEEIKGNEEVQRAYLGGLEAGFQEGMAARPSRSLEGKEILRLQDVNSFYGESHILHNVGLNVRNGEIVTLLGRNGAGKTTTLRTILGLTPPSSGSITFNGERVSGLAPQAVVNRGISLVPAERRVFANLTVQENLELPFFTKGIPTSEKRSQIEQAYKYFPTLERRRYNKGNKLSGGEQQMLAMARALMGRVSLVLLDEPSQGLAPIIVKNVADIIREINNRGVTILLVEQNALLALELADRVYVIDKGLIVYEGQPQTLLADRELSQRLLGV